MSGRRARPKPSHANTSAVLRTSTASATKSGTRLIARQQSLSVRSGPLPPAEDLAAYDAVTAGAAQRIIAMAEREQNHRHAQEAAAVRLHSEELSLRRRGQSCALALGLILIAAGAFAIFMGQPEAACAVFAALGAGALSVFLGGRPKST